MPSAWRGSWCGESPRLRGAGSTIPTGDRNELEPVRQLLAERSEAIAFGALGVGMVELEDGQAVHQVGPAQREGVVTGPDDDVLLDSLCHRFFEAVFRIARSRMDLACDRPQPTQELPHDDPVEKPVLADASPARAPGPADRRRRWGGRRVDARPGSPPQRRRCGFSDGSARILPGACAATAPDPESLCGPSLRSAAIE
jgi:hypothetical protein